MPSVTPCPFCGEKYDHFAYDKHKKSCPFYQLAYNQGVMDDDHGNVSRDERYVAWNTRTKNPPDPEKRTFEFTISETLGVITRTATVRASLEYGETIGDHIKEVSDALVGVLLGMEVIDGGG